MSAAPAMPTLVVSVEFTRVPDGTEIVIWKVRDQLGAHRFMPRVQSEWKVPHGRIDQAILQEIEVTLDAVIDYAVDERFGTQMSFAGL